MKAHPEPVTKRRAQKPGPCGSSDKGKSLEIELVDHMDYVLQKALVINEGEDLFKEETDSSFCLTVASAESDNNTVAHH